eukprot:TRINITY_DN7861_c0_g1_i1.p1 TRINITY_DN7861_c0_g1~~TRINITY_DN7861_c0_g1_i1.p1  ORF type:complete len:520 (-),score=38.04 TRINITY_DN7861_c0_g1_i1:44-1603(-)
MSTFFAFVRLEHPEIIQNNDLPIIQPLVPLQAFIGWNPQNRPEFTNLINFNNQPQIPLKNGLRYYNVSRSSVLFCVSGNSNAYHTQDPPNVRLFYPNPNHVGMVVKVVFCSPERERTVTELRIGNNRVAEINVPLVETVMPFAPNYAGPWKAIEVHTTINRSDVRVIHRIEHHDFNRVPYPDYWARNGGYGRVDPSTLNKQSQAAICYQYATYVILKYSRWDQVLCAQYPGAKFKLMGFETNNPYHDDFSGTGAHWHLAVRGTTDKLIYSTPHIYMDGEGRCLALEHHKLFHLGPFVARVGENGCLELNPLTKIRNVTSGKYLHVLLGKQNQRDAVHMFNNEEADNPGNLWMLEHDTSNSTLLRSFRSGRYLHVRLSLIGEGNEVSMFNESVDGGDHWKITRHDGTCRILNVRSNTLLSSTPNAGDRDKALQKQSNDICTEWQLDWNHNLEYSYKIQMRAEEGRATAAILRNGVEWAQIGTSDSTNGDLGTISFRAALQGEEVFEEIHYNRFTGNNLRQ